MSYISSGYYGKFSPVRRKGGIPDYDIYSEAYAKWIEEQEYYFRNGYDAGGDHITGEQYFMLNFGTILITDSNGDKQPSSPYYVDAHREIFDAIAECYKTGEDLFVAKARDKGFSDIITHCALFNCMTVPNRKTLALFPSGENKAMEIFKDKYSLAWKNLIADFKHFPGIKDDKSIKTYGRIDGEGNEVGINTTLVTLKAVDADVAKGGRYKTIFVDEVGEIDSPLALINTNQANMREGSKKFGIHIVGGTSNAVNASGYADFRALTRKHTELGFKFIFIPAQKIYWGYVNLETGESDEEGALIDVKERGKGKEGEALMKYQQNYPTTIEEMLMAINDSPFSAEKIEAQKSRIETDKSITDQIQQGDLYYDIGSGEVKFRENRKSGKWKIFRHPKPNLISPDVIATDSYRLQDAVKSEKMSKGAIIVRRPYQGLSELGGLTIAILLDRPDDKEEFFQECIKAEKYWNALNLIEHTDADIIKYHLDNGMAKHMYRRPSVLDEVGTHSKAANIFGINPSPQAVGRAVEVAISEFNKTWENEVFIEVLDDLGSYTVKNIDLGMAYIWSTVAALDMVTNKPRAVARKEYFVPYVTTDRSGNRLVVNSLRMDKALNPQKYKAA